MVEILSVTLKNFKAHHDRAFTFQPGTNAISGENGAGKTSILEAIAWVLFDHKGEYRTEDLIRNGAATAQATVRFVSSRDDRTYEIQRNTRSGYVIYDPQLNEKLNVARIKEEVLPWLRENLGVSPGTDLSELFASTIGVPQGTFTADFQLTPEKRKAVFDRVLKVEEYQKTYKDFNSLEKYAKARSESLSRELEQYEEQLKEWEPLQQQQHELEQEIDQAKSDLEIWQTKLASMQAEQQRIGSQAAQLQAVTQQITTAQGQVETQLQLLQQLQVQLEQSEQSVAICTEQRQSYQLVLEAEAALKALETQRQEQQNLLQQKQVLVEQTLDRKAQLTTLTQQLQRCADFQVEYDRLQPRINQQIEREKQQQELQQQQQHLSSWRQTLSRDEGRSSQLQQRSSQLQQTIGQLQGLEAAIGQIPELEQQQQRYQQQLSRIDAAAQFEADLRQILAQAQQRGTLHWQAVTSAVAILNQVQPMIAGENPAIATVLQTLENGAGLQQQLVQDLQAILDDLAEQVVADRLKQMIQQLQTQLQALRQQQTQYLTLESKQKEQAQLLAEMMDLKAQIQQAKAQLASEPALQQQLKQVQAELQALEDPRGRSRFLQQEIQQQKGLAQQKRQLQASLAATDATIAAVDEQLQGFTDLDRQMLAQQTQRDQHRPHYNLYLEHQKSANRFKPLKQDCVVAENKLETSQHQMQTLLIQQQTLAATLDPTTIETIQAAYQEANTQTIRLQAQLPEKLKRQTAIAQQVEKLAAIQEKCVNLQAQLKQQQKVDRFIKFARKAYKEAGPRITELYVQSIAKEADKLFRELLNRPNVALEWTRDYEIIVREGANARRFVNLSGGEQMCAALSVRLALLKILADINIAFFDEPTTNMDRPRRIQLAEAIANIRSFKQLFVISHDDTFEQVTENVILVERETVI
jgi:DNA repair protein SbcC/Rad50